MLVFVILGEVTSRLEKMQRNFLLRGRDFGEKVAYGELIYSLDKSNEGLGIRNLSTFNKVLIRKKC